MNILHTLRSIFELPRRPALTPVPDAPPPEALHRDLVFEVFESGVGITYHDVSKPRPKDAPQVGTYMSDPVYDAPMDMYRMNYVSLTPTTNILLHRACFGPR